MVAGQVEVMFDTSPASIAFIRAGKLRPLAVTTAARWEGLPDIPTVSESVPGYEANSWYGIGAPRATPSDVIDRLNKEINAGLADPMVKARLAEIGGTTLPGPATEFGRLLTAEADKWGRVVKFASIKPE
jgi:tripartite-type tricarboxylate transporter receptor subunit TctC